MKLVKKILKMLKDRVEVETWQNDWFGSGQLVTGQVYSYFSNNFFFFNYKNKSMTICLERMNKI